MDYYLLRGDEQTGPFSEYDVRASLQRGELRVDDLAWHEGAPDWQPIGPILGLPLGEPATARQRAFLEFMGVTAPPEATRQQAAVLVNDAMEKEPSRLARWNEERLHLHPELFVEEIQARKEGRAQKFYEICQRDGAKWFDRVARAHCQVLVGHLDVQAPHWDAHDVEATQKHFFPALAQKFPQLLTPEGRAHFRQRDTSGQSSRGGKHHSAASGRKRPTGRQVLGAIVRGSIYGALILTALWFGRAHLERAVAMAAQPPISTPAPAASAAPAATEEKPAESKAEAPAAPAEEAAPKPDATPSPAPAPAEAGAMAASAQ